MTNSMSCEHVAEPSPRGNPWRSERLFIQAVEALAADALIPRPEAEEMALDLVLALRMDFAMDKHVGSIKDASEVTKIAGNAARELAEALKVIEGNTGASWVWSSAGLNHQLNLGQSNHFWRGMKNLPRWRAIQEAITFAEDIEKQAREIQKAFKLSLGGSRTLLSGISRETTQLKHVERCFLTWVKTGHPAKGLKALSLAKPIWKLVTKEDEQDVKGEWGREDLERARIAYNLRSGFLHGTSLRGPQLRDALLGGPGFVPRRKGRKRT